MTSFFSPFCTTGPRAFFLQLCKKSQSKVLLQNWNYAFLCYLGDENEFGPKKWINYRCEKRACMFCWAGPKQGKAVKLSKSTMTILTIAYMPFSGSLCTLVWDFRPCRSVHDEKKKPPHPVPTQIALREKGEKVVWRARGRTCNYFLIQAHWWLNLNSNEFHLTWLAYG